MPEKEIVFSSFEELQELVSDGSMLPAVSLLCTAENLTISEDIEIPSGMIITFRSFTVPEGIQLTVTESSEIRTYGFTVQGNLVNRGKIIQQDLSAAGAEEGIVIAAHIPGHVENKGEMILTDVFGKRNINRFGGQLTMYETASYRDKLRIISGDDTPTPTTEVVKPPEQTPALSKNSTAREIFDLLEDIIPKLSFFFVLACLFVVVKIGITSRLRENRKKSSTVRTNTPDKSVKQEDILKTMSKQANVSSGEDHFQRDKSKRIEQLDDWLENGLIDRKEYRELKRRYREDR